MKHSKIFLALSFFILSIIFLPSHAAIACSGTGVVQDACCQTVGETKINGNGTTIAGTAILACLHETSSPSSALAWKSLSESNSSSFPAYIEFNGITMNILKSHNITGLARLSAGAYRVTFAPRPNANYLVLTGAGRSRPAATAPYSSTVGLASYFNRTTSSVDIVTSGPSTPLDTPYVSMAIID